MIKRAVQIGDARLRAKSKPVAVKNIRSKAIQSLIKDLTDSMRHYGLVGMAAPQIGVNLNVFVTEIRKNNARKAETDQLRVFINPKFISLSKKKEDMLEGCGSVDFGAIHGPVRRHVQVAMQAYDQNANLFEIETAGLLSEILQHEYDHLQGILCIDKFSDTKKIYYREKK